MTASRKTTTPREITFRVRRFDPDVDSAPHWSEYRLHVHDGMTVLEALHETQSRAGTDFVVAFLLPHGSLRFVRHVHQ